MDRIQLVMVTGLSGAGKTSCMAVFENLEFQCIDNAPIELLEQFANLLKTSKEYTKVAYAVKLKDALQAARILSNLDWIDLSILFLDANDDVLLKRYKQSRRSHPLLISERAASLQEAIEFERELAKPVLRISNKVIDTSMMKTNKLQQLIEDYYLHSETDPFRISFISFGYKHGIPKDLDLMFDVRFLPNPFYVDELREQTGNDKAVYDYVMEKPETQEFVEVLTPTLDYLFKNFEQEGRMHLVVGIGCTGGQHRSVTLTNYFADHYAKIYQVHRLHRDADH
ncbi:RNase adapter RapZ [Beduini massiliensis]|uniref:RNase adapter RapZ n=1 Tax=Beduini massiliensis TaxID=1585974 RepID=UPI00059A8E3B|nr:RNase adapter RapZ [Beduini massiliensis]